MPLYKNNTFKTLLKNDCKPAQFYIGNKKIAGWKEQSFNATLVSQNDTYNDSAFLKIYGNSEQIQTIQGKNLFDAYNYTTNYPDDIKVINQDGEDWIKMQSSNKQIRYNLKAKENTQHTFTFEFKRYGDTGAYSAVFVLYYTDGTNETIDFGYYGDGILHKVSKTSAENKTISYIRSSNYGNTVYFLLRVANSQLEEGTTATSYEPFIPNSPSPDYPSTINSVSNFDLISNGKNLFNIARINEYTANTYWGLKNIIINDTDFEVYTPLSGSAGYGYKVEVKPNTTYTASAIVLQKGQVIGYDECKNVVLNIGSPQSSWIRRIFMPNLNQLYSRTFTTEANETEVYISFNNEIGYGGIDRGNYTSSFVKPTIVSQVRLVEGNQPLVNYEPYKGNTINFSYTLRSLPDGTKDYIEIDNVNKTSRLYRNIGNVTLESGTEWTVEGAVENSSIRCTHLTNNVLVGTTLTSSTAVSSSHDIIYQLETSIITDLEYEEVKTYYTYTNIYTNATIQPMLDGKIRIIDKGE